MDQDLSLMEQLLTLNDKIEEMKHKYMYSVSKDSLGASSCELSVYHDYTGSEMSLASLDINDYNENCLLGSDMDLRTTNEEADDEVFESLNDTENHKIHEKIMAFNPGARSVKDPLKLYGHKSLQVISQDFRRSSQGFSINSPKQEDSPRSAEELGTKQSETFVFTNTTVGTSELSDTEDKTDTNIAHSKENQNAVKLINEKTTEFCH